MEVIMMAYRRVEIGMGEDFLKRANEVMKV